MSSSCDDTVPEDVKQERVRVNQMLSSIGSQLDKRYRKMTQLGAISRDITWESKRAISQALGCFQNPNALKNAENTINHIRHSNKCFKGLALSLLNEDMYLLGRFYTAGLQEFIEAMAVVTFLKHGTIITYEEILEVLTVELPGPPKETSPDEKQSGTIKFAIQLTKREFYLGLLDMTGELVRACANVVSTTGSKAFLLKSLALVRALYQCTNILHPMGKDLQDKCNVMRQSMIKLEIACFDCVVGRKMSQFFFTKQIKGSMDDQQETEDSGYD